MDDERVIQSILDYSVDILLSNIYEPRHGKMCLRGKFGHFEIL